MKPDVKHQLGAALSVARQGNTTEAIERLTVLTEYDPDNSQVWNELGVLHYQNRNQSRALDCFQRAVACDPDHARALVNLGACHNELGNNSAAINCYEMALGIAPQFADAWSNLGKLYNDGREYECGAYCYQRALGIERKPVYLRGLGSAYRLSGRFSRAMAAFQEAIDRQPDDAFSHTALAALHFYHGDYAAGLREYEWRWHLPESQAHKAKYPQLFAAPPFDGGSLRNKTVLVHTEQGYGDNLLFCRYLPMLKAQAGRVVLWCWPGLVDLFRDNFDLDHITGDARQLPAHDVQIPLLSLPLHLDPELAAMGECIPYLTASPRRETDIAAPPSSLNVGIAWGCDHNGFDYLYKKVPFETLAPLFDVPGTSFHSLQLNPDRTELINAPSPHGVTDLAPRLPNFKATAEVIAQLDLVISVDTAVAHLAAAMGKPTWVLLKKNPDWRWHGYDGHPLWYPNARVFCQHPLDSWEAVVRRMRTELIRAQQAKS